ncbi:MAG: hypothetical protein AMJ75_00440 [Phycisphaerae bacterium SM1_79]|nr:MAG: hypothetical protein AMJ75_00440 [Phycisphaerae bacterium SM1_79]
MDAYIYKAALYCEDCIEKIKAELTPPADPKHKNTYDSDDYPKGPYADGGGEADAPQHCYGCGVFLENQLTTDGYKYVLATVQEYIYLEESIANWFEFYQLQLTY